MNQPSEKQGNGLAIGALVCSLLFCVPLLPLVGIVLAIVVLARKTEAGRTLAIVAIVVGVFSVIANVGMLAAIAIPNFVRYQQRSKQAEARTNLGAIRISQTIFGEERGFFAGCPPEGNDAAGKTSDWEGRPCSSECSSESPAACNFSCIGFQPATKVYYRYACTSAPGAFTCAASADLDGDGEHGVFMVSHSDEGAAPAPIPSLPGAEHCQGAPPNLVHECRRGVF